MCSFYSLHIRFVFPVYLIDRYSSMSGSSSLLRLLRCQSHISRLHESSVSKGRTAAPGRVYNNYSTHINRLTKMSEDKVHLYTAWHSPFGWRAWVSLLEKGLPFEYHETDPYEKSPEWFKISPRGLAPVVYHKGNAVYESTICIEYIDEAFPHEPRLMPTDPFDRAYVRMWADHVNKRIIPHIFGMIVKQDAADQEQAKQDALDGIEAYLGAMRGDGPWFMGKQFTVADIVLGTFASIFFCMDHYRGFKVPENDEKFARFHPWIKAIKARKSWQAVLPSREQVLEDWRPYAEGKAQTELAKAARLGKTP